MTIYVDNASILHKGRYRSHMAADSLAELHGAAWLHGINRCWFDGMAKGHPHYDVTAEQRLRVVHNGAREVDSRELLRVSKLCR